MFCVTIKITFPGRLSYSHSSWLAFSTIDIYQGCLCNLCNFPTIILNEMMKSMEVLYKVFLLLFYLKCFKVIYKFIKVITASLGGGSEQKYLLMKHFSVH